MKNVLRDFSYGVYIVTTYDKEKRKVGCTINSAMQITANPKTIAISINHDNYTNQSIKESNVFALSILSEKIDPFVITTFGFKTSKDTDKFKDISYDIKKDLPVIKDSCGYVTCHVISTLETETHTIFIGEVEDMDSYQEEKPMTYSYYHENLKGTTPKNAPTYEEKNVVEEIKNNRWRCKVCGYIYEGESLADDFICPLCKAPKEMFEKIE